ncbi:MAG: hypothetical protein U1F06_04280 [Steroidobacteraceae bacterium]
MDAVLQSRLADMLQALQRSALAGLSAVDDLLSGLGVSGLAAGGSGTAGAAVAAEASMRERTTLRFVTQQGDVVELELRARARMGVAAASGSAGDATVTAASGRVVGGASLEIHVRGDLDDQELAAIGAVLGKVEALASQFHAGDVAAAFAAAGALQIDGSQLASVAVDLRQSLRVQAAAATTSTPAGAAGAAGSAPSAQATAGGFLAGAMDQLDAAGAAVAQLGLRQKLQLLVQATAQAAPAGDPAVAKLADSVQSLG